MLRPRSGYQQWISSEKYFFNPTPLVTEFTDNYGNLCQRLVAPAGNFQVCTEAEVFVSDSIDQAAGGPFIEIHNLPDSVLSYLLPSRYCDCEYFSQLAQEITVGKNLGYDQVAAIDSWIRSSIRYELHESDIPASASEVNARQWGVCRDFAHLGISLCRALTIPARMVVGYLHGLEPMDLHAWFEAYVADKWYTFDPTQKELKGGYVVLGYGRDAADVAVFNQFGPAVFPITKEVMVQQLDHVGWQSTT